MHSLAGIRAINANNKPVKPTRYLAILQGDRWRVYDSHIGGTGGTPYEFQVDAQARADELNAKWESEVNKGKD